MAAAVGPGSQLGRYQLIDELGSGGMATVYRARDRELRREVAVKVLFPHLAKKAELTRRFQREARAAAGLEHPNILRVYDVGADGAPHIVMELVRGQSLRERAEAEGALLAELVAAIGACLCAALAVAHAAGVVHRDVKPANVMIADDGRLLLADFGVARIDDGMSTRLHYQLADQRGLAYSIGAAIEPLADTALFEITSATANAKLPTLVAEILGLVGGLREEAIGADELAKIRTRYRYETVASLDDSAAMAGWFGGTALVGASGVVLGPLVVRLTKEALVIARAARATPPAPGPATLAP